MTHSSDDGAPENPFERWDIDPLGGPGAITERMRELVENAPDVETQKALRAAWSELTMHPARRVRAALGAHPDTHGPRGAPPPAPRPASARDDALELDDLLLRPSVLAVLADGCDPELPDVPFDLDPHLTD